jgi:hypothetical protein
MVSFVSVATRSSSGFHSGADSLPRAISLSSFIAPTMSRLIIATTLSSGTGECSTRYAEPPRPTSSAEKNATTIVRRSFASFSDPVSCRAATSTAAVPDALSSAPLWMPVSFGFIEPRPPKPR